MKTKTKTKKIKASPAVYDAKKTRSRVLSTLAAPRRKQAVRGDASLSVGIPPKAFSRSKCLLPRPLSESEHARLYALAKGKPFAAPKPAPVTAPLPTIGKRKMAPQMALAYARRRGFHARAQEAMIRLAALHAPPLDVPECLELKTQQFSKVGADLHRHDGAHTSVGGSVIKISWSYDHTHKTVKASDESRWRIKNKQT